MHTVTALLLIVIFVLVVGASAYLAFLTTSATITEDLRERALEAIRAPGQRAYETELDAYQARVQRAIERFEVVPVDAPPPPADPKLAVLLQCRKCVAFWTSLLVVIVTRLALTATYPPLWGAIPLHPLDLLFVPGAVLACAYAVAWLASNEGE